MFCCPAPPVLPSADRGRFSRPAHHAPQATTHAAIAVANAALTTHRSASAFGRNDSLIIAANHKESPKATTDATPVASHLTARPTEPTSYFPRLGKPRSPGSPAPSMVPIPPAPDHRVSERGGRFCCHGAAIQPKGLTAILAIRPLTCTSW